MEHAEITVEQTRRPDRGFRASLAAIVFLAGSIALVNPAHAGECQNMADLVRAAARDNNLSEEGMRAIEQAIDKAMKRLAHGDEEGCLSELALAREALNL